MSTIALHHILVKSPLLAQDILRELQLGAEFGDLAAEYSACPSARQQGFAGYHDTDQLPTTLVQAIFGQGEQAIAGPYQGPVRTQFGYHIVRSADQVPRPMLFDEQAG